MGEVFSRVLDAANWLLTSTGPTLVVLGLLGYMFREKWKQLLSKSLNAELERLKHQLVLEQQLNAASLAPQLEAVKHDFQKDLESYRTSLIAQAEAVKAKSDVRKSIAVRFMELQFERLCTLEVALSKSGTRLPSMCGYPEHVRELAQLTEALALVNDLSAASSACEMFFDPDEWITVVEHEKRLIGLLNHIGKEKEILPINAEKLMETFQSKNKVDTLVRAKIASLAAL